MKDDRIIFRLSSELKSALSHKAERLGKKQSEILIELIQNFVETPEEPSELGSIKAELSELRAAVAQVQERQKELVGKSTA